MNDDPQCWQRADFEFDLPNELIAHEPPAERSASRLLVLAGDSDAPQDSAFSEILNLCRPGDLLVRNNTKVLPARLLAQRPTGGRVELLLERLDAEDEAWVQIGQSKPVKIGQRVEVVGTDVRIDVVDRSEGFFKVRFDRPAQTVFERFGKIPLPPYIEREPTAGDVERYQTVYATQVGAVAAPTAGLHFTPELFDQLRQRGVGVAEVTLHVGAGTFKPVKVHNIRNHVMHPEWVDVPPETVAAIAATKAQGRRVIAIGTTSVRSLETAARVQPLASYRGDSRLFITPGFEFRVVDAMITNFHLSGSTLMMLVSAFAGHERVVRAYQHAIAKRYRFFSYGDAMWLERPHQTSGT